MAEVLVVGGSLPGLAAALRLAKVGHAVTLLERRDELGGRWRLPGALPPILPFPAPWRDLLKKSGRAFDAELARRGLQLVPAPPVTHVFDDGSQLCWPSDRGEQWHTLAGRYGTGVATHWRATLDDLDDVWQSLRRLGLETELTDPEQVRSRRRELDAYRTVEDLARHVDHPDLSELIRDVARLMGSEPRRTPGWLASRLSVDRTFGRWQLLLGDAPQPMTRLLDVIVARLTDRGVRVLTGITVEAVGHAWVATDAGELRGDAIVSAVNPWEHARLAARVDPAGRRRTARTAPALAPRVTVEVVPEARPPGETVRHTGSGPVVSWHRPVDGGTEVTTHDHRAPHADWGFGTRWDGARTWLRLQPVRTEGVPTLVTASSSGRGGSEPWAQLLGAALATYAIHETLTGEDIRPSNRRSRPVR